MKRSRATPTREDRSPYECKSSPTHSDEDGVPPEPVAEVSASGDRRKQTEAVDEQAREHLKQMGYLWRILARYSVSIGESVTQLLGFERVSSE